MQYSVHSHPIPDLYQLSLFGKSLFFFLMTPSCAVTSLIPQTGKLQPLPSLQTLKKKSQAGQTLGICI